MDSASKEIHIYHADAGAGKTRKLMDIISQHVEAGIPLHRIAFVTYTRAAAEVAKQRVCERFGVNIKEAPPAGRLSPILGCTLVLVSAFLCPHLYQSCRQ